VVTNTGPGRPCLLAVGTGTAAPEQLPDLGRSLTGGQSGQAASQASNFHSIAAWQVLSTACTNLNMYAIPEFSIDLNFQDVMTSKLKKIGRQCTKSKNHAVGLQGKSSRNLMQNKTYFICVTNAPRT